MPPSWRSTAPIRSTPWATCRRGRATRRTRACRRGEPGSLCILQRSLPLPACPLLSGRRAARAQEHAPSELARPPALPSLLPSAVPAPQLGRLHAARLPASRGRRQVRCCCAALLPACPSEGSPADLAAACERWAQPPPALSLPAPPSQVHLARGQPGLLRHGVQPGQGARGGSLTACGRAHGQSSQLSALAHGLPPRSPSPRLLPLSSIAHSLGRSSTRCPEAIMRCSCPREWPKASWAR